MIRDYANIATDYASRVAAGDVIAGRLTRLAAMRHLDDLDRDDFPYRFDAARAAKVCRFIELLPHVKGKWARSGETIRLEDWQVFILASAFGWVHKDTGFRRFRVCYINVQRKNGKSAISAGVGLYMLAADGEHGAEVYCGATTEDQAQYVFKPAKQMVEKTADLREAFGIEVYAHSLVIPENGSTMEAVIGKPGDGANPSCAIIDEYHEHDTDDLYETMVTGQGARDQPLTWIITTSGTNLGGPCYEMNQDVVRVLEGTVSNEELFGVIYAADGDEDWTSEIALRKANPNYGVSVSGDFLKVQVRDAMTSARRQTVVKTKHLGIWCNARSAWMNMEAWNACGDPTLSRDDFKGESCWEGVDLASKIDLTSRSTIFIRRIEGVDHYYVFTRHYVPEARVEEPDQRNYQQWVAQGYLTATYGEVIDYDRIHDDAVQDAHNHRVIQFGYDPYGATQLAVNLQKEGIPVLEVPQKTRFLSEPMKWVEAMVLAGRLHHDDNPVMNWMMSNVTAREDANHNVFPRRDQKKSKIDGAVALIIAMSVATREEEEKPKPRVRTI